MNTNCACCSFHVIHSFFVSSVCALDCVRIDDLYDTSPLDIIFVSKPTDIRGKLHRGFHWREKRTKMKSHSKIKLQRELDTLHTTLHWARKLEYKTYTSNPHLQGEDTQEHTLQANTYSMTRGRPSTQPTHQTTHHTILREGHL